MFVFPIKKVKDIDAVKCWLKSKNIRDYILFIIAINTGVKICRLLGLKVNDLYDGKTVLRKEVELDGKYITFSSYVMKELEQNASYFTDKEYLFQSRKGKLPIDRSHVYRIIKEAAKECNITCSIGIESLRKTYGYHYYRKTNDIKFLQDFYSHHNVDETYKYLNIEENEKGKLEIQI